MFVDLTNYPELIRKLDKLWGPDWFPPGKGGDLEMGHTLGFCPILKDHCHGVDCVFWSIDKKGCVFYENAKWLDDRLSAISSALENIVGAINALGTISRLDNKE